MNRTQTSEVFRIHPRAGRLRLGGPRAQVSLLVLWCLAAFGGCGKRSEPDQIVASGYIEATEVRVSAQVGGIAKFLGAQEGDRVTVGQTLARLDTVDVVLALRAAKGDRDQAGAEWRLRLAGARIEDIREAEAQLQRAQTDLDGAERDLARAEALLATGSGTEKACDDARTRRDLARATRNAYQEQLHKRQHASRAEEIEAAGARLESAEARVAQLEQQRLDTTIKSPIAGVLTERLVEVGELLTAGAGICTIADLERPWLTTYVGERDLGRIRLGAAATILTDDGQQRTGSITFISDRAEFTPRNAQTRQEREKLVYRIKVTLENRDGLFKPGMPAEARLQVAGAKP